MFPLIMPLHAVVEYHFAYRLPESAPARRVWTTLLLVPYVGGVVAAAGSVLFNIVYFSVGPVEATRWLAEHRWSGYRGALSNITYFANRCDAPRFDLSSITRPDQRLLK